MAATQPYSLSGSQSAGIVDRLSRVPTPMGGLALGTASLGAAWALIIPDSAGTLKVTAAIIASLLILKILAKFLFHPHLIQKELAHPVVSSVMPTCAMGTMIIAQSFLPYAPTFAKGLWLVAVICHLLLLVGFVFHRAIEFKLEHMVPSWFVPPVGIIVAAVSSTGMGYENMVHGLFVFGLGCYFIKLPFMFYRLIFRDTIPDAALPTFAIMAAPASLSLAGYLTITSQPDPVLLIILAPLALFMTGLVYLAFIRLLRLPFSPGYSAFTFPMVIGATALIKLTQWLKVNDVYWLGNIVEKLAYAELLIATTIVFYVGIRYLMHYLPRTAR